MVHQHALISSMTASAAPWTPQLDAAHSHVAPHLCIWRSAGRLDILHLLLEYSQSQAWLRCEGSTPLHMAACLSGIPARRNDGLEAAKLLVMSKASVFDK